MPRFPEADRCWLIGPRTHRGWAEVTQSLLVRGLLDGGVLMAGTLLFVAVREQAWPPLRRLLDEHGLRLHRLAGNGQGLQLGGEPAFVVGQLHAHDPAGPPAPPAPPASNNGDGLDSQV